MIHAPGTRVRRSGLTLLEVIVAMAIFLVALAAIGQLVRMGADRAMDAENTSLALQKCQSKLADFASGAEALGSQTSVPFSDDDTGRWTWTADAEQQEVTNLWRIKVIVTYAVDNDSKLEVSLTQMILDPAVRVYTPPAAAASSSGSSSSSSSSSTSGTSSTTGSGTTTGGSTTTGSGAASSGTGSNTGSGTGTGTGSRTGGSSKTGGG